MKDHDVWTACGIAGIVGIACVLVAIFVPFPETQLGTSAGMLLASGFPVLGIVLAYGLHGYIAAEREGAANRLAFVFAAAAFTTLLAMLFVQLAVVSGIGTMARELDEVAARSLKRGLRLVDFGLDVAWDFLIGTALILWGVAMRRRSGFGLGWAIPSVAFGVALIGLNAATFPWPPGDHGLFDIGPFIALFMAGMAGRLVVLGRRAARTGA